MSSTIGRGFEWANNFVRVTSNIDYRTRKKIIVINARINFYYDIRHLI